MCIPKTKHLKLFSQKNAHQSASAAQKRFTHLTALTTINSK